MRRPVFRGIVASLVIAFALPLQADRWGPHGHSEITYDSATAHFHLPPEIAKVMALGSLAPDYFEFNVPAAHAQVEDPPIKNNQLAVSEDGYRGLQRKGFIDSFKWHDFYFKAAVAAMQHGQRERAAFLLGYALHNIEDLGTHQGMPNLVHASLDAGGASPDFETTGLALSHTAASLDIAAFREQIGTENWQLFQGHSVRRPNGTTLVPEPMHTFVNDLDRWNPRSGILPPPSDPSWLTNPNRAELQAAFKTAAEHSYASTTAGQEVDGKTVMAYNFLEGLLPRQEQMLELLHLSAAEMSELGIVRRAGDPWEPELKGAKEMWDYMMEALDFEKHAPKRFRALSKEDQALLASTNWLDCAADLQRKMVNQTSEARRKLIVECADRIDRLSEQMKRSQETLRWLAWQRAQFKDYEADYAAEVHYRQVLRVPSVDARPTPEPERASASSRSSSSSGGSRSESHSSSSQSEHSSSINFNSPTYNGLKSGSIHF